MALNKTVIAGIKLDYNETVFHLAIKILKMTSIELKEKSLAKSYKYAKRQNRQARRLNVINL